MTDPEAPPGPQPHESVRVWGALLLLAGLVGVAAHQVLFWDWWVEDAAISFAYARNWANGDGLVPFIGGEVLEGYSNPTWVALLAVFEWMGFESFALSKTLQVALAVLTGLGVIGLSQELEPTRPYRTSVLAMVLLATSSSFGVWGSSGLENALFNAILTFALWRTCVDQRSDGPPFAALLWCLLALTRPEAILYAAIAGAGTLAWTWNRPKKVALWLALFFVPFLTYHAVHYQVFGYPFPQTYYAKLHDEKDVTRWTSRGWRYVREWYAAYGMTVPLAAVTLALTGFTRARLLGAAVVWTVVGGWLWLPELVAQPLLTLGNLEIKSIVGPGQFPTWWVGARPYVVFIGALSLGTLGWVSRGGWRIRSMLFAHFLGVLFFAVYSDGDWMANWRWINLAIVPLVLLIATGLGRGADVAERVVNAAEARWPTGWWDVALASLIAIGPMLHAVAARGRPPFGSAVWVYVVVGAVAVAAFGFWAESKRRRFAGWVFAMMVSLAVIWPNLRQSEAFNNRPVTSPQDVGLRVAYKQEVKRTLDHELPIIDLDVDQGAHLWWGNGDLRMMDLAGLVDVPMAQHRFAERFFEAYVFEERKPEFVHIHGGWLRSSRIEKFPGWDEEYHEIPGYGFDASRVLHTGNYIRRDLVFPSNGPLAGGWGVELDERWVLERLDVPSEAATGDTAWVRVAVRSMKMPQGRHLPEALIVASQAGRVVKTWSIPLAHDWFLPTGWYRNDVYVGGHELDLKRVPPGRYDLGMVLISPRQYPLKPVGPLPDGLVHGTSFIEGEVVAPEGLVVVTADERKSLAREDRERSLSLASEHQCEEAETAWDHSRWHRAGDTSYRDTYRPFVAQALATCWATRKGADRFADLQRASLWDPRAPALWEERAPLADQACADGYAAADAESRFRALDRCVKLDPTRSWARRDAERARSTWLKLDEPPSPEPKLPRTMERVLPKPERILGPALPPESSP